VEVAVPRVGVLGRVGRIVSSKIMPI